MVPAKKKIQFHPFKINPISFVLEMNHIVYFQVYISNIVHLCTKVFLCTTSCDLAENGRMTANLKGLL